jgi:hypothetical protein
MAQCWKCKAENKEGSKFCNECGSYQITPSKRQKDFEEYERNYLNKLNRTEETPEEVKEEPGISKTTRHNENYDVLPSNNSGLGWLVFPKPPTSKN